MSPAQNPRFSTGTIPKMRPSDMEHGFRGPSEDEGRIFESFLGDSNSAHYVSDKDDIGFQVNLTELERKLRMSERKMSHSERRKVSEALRVLKDVSKSEHDHDIDIKDQFQFLGQQLQHLTQSMNQCFQGLLCLQRDVSQLTRTVERLSSKPRRRHQHQQRESFPSSRDWETPEVFYASLEEENEDDMSTGFALNNQIPPGMRPNNYWDNFRSFSRQNRLGGGGGGAVNVTPFPSRQSSFMVPGLNDSPKSSVPSPSRPKRKSKINREQNRENINEVNLNNNHHHNSNSNNHNNNNHNNNAMIFPSTSPLVNSLTRSIYHQINSIISRHSDRPEQLARLFHGLQTLEEEQEGDGVVNWLMSHNGSIGDNNNINTENDEEVEEEVNGAAAVVTNSVKAVSKNNVQNFIRDSNKVGEKRSQNDSNFIQKNNEEEEEEEELTSVNNNEVTPRLNEMAEADQLNVVVQEEQEGDKEELGGLYRTPLRLFPDERWGEEQKFLPPFSVFPSDTFSSDDDD